MCSHMTYKIRVDPAVVVGGWVGGGGCSSPPSAAEALAPLVLLKPWSPPLVPPEFLQ